MNIFSSSTAKIQTGLDWTRSSSLLKVDDLQDSELGYKGGFGFWERKVPHAASYWWRLGKRQSPPKGQSS